jgi:MFS family permease
MTKKERYTIVAFMWHGFFLAITVAMLDLNTVFPVLVNTLSGSKLIFGILYSIMLGVPLLFNVIFSHFLKRFSRKKPFLLFGIYLRGLSFLGMALFVYYFALDNPSLVVSSFFVFVFLFSIAGGMAGLSYVDIIGKMVSKEKRTTFYTMKQFVGSSSSFLGGLIIARIFSLGIDYPLNYSLSLFIGFIGLFVASLLFLFLKEDIEDMGEDRESFVSYIKGIPNIVKTDSKFKQFIIVENLSSFSIMVLPFYIIYAREMMHVEDSYIGIYLVIQISGTILSNIVWGFLAKRFSAKTIVRFCIILGGLNPILALLAAMVSPLAYGLVFFVLGFTISGRKIGFEPYLLDIAPTNKRIQYLGIRGSLNILIVLLPMIGALLITSLGYVVTFSLVTLVMLLASVLLGRKGSEEYIEYCK